MSPTHQRTHPPNHPDSRFRTRGYTRPIEHLASNCEYYTRHNSMKKLQNKYIKNVKFCLKTPWNVPAFFNSVQDFDMVM